MTGSASLGVTAIIPARGGSKGIPRKNLRPLAGKPLVNWSVEAARMARLVTRVIVSTDSEEIASTARAAGADVPFMRPPHLAEDSVHAVHVVLHALDWLEEHEGVLPDVVVMLLPTSPFRLPPHIDGAIEVFLEKQPPSVVSVCIHEKPIMSLRVIRDGRLVPLQKAENLDIQRQDVEPIYAVNGSIYVSRPSALRQHKSFHGSEAAAYVMPRLNSLDINTLEDLALANLLADSFARTG